MAQAGQLQFSFEKGPAEFEEAFQVKAGQLRCPAEARLANPEKDTSGSSRSATVSIRNGTSRAQKIRPGPKLASRSSVDPRFDAYCALIKECWDQEEEKRPSFKQIIMRLIHLKNMKPVIAPPPSRGAAASSSSSFPSSAAAAAAGVLSSSADENNPDVDLSNYEWYFGDLKKDVAMRMLVGKPEGTFLIRNR